MIFLSWLMKSHSVAIFVVSNCMSIESLVVHKKTPYGSKCPNCKFRFKDNEKLKKTRILDLMIKYHKLDCLLYPINEGIGKHSPKYLSWLFIDL